MGDAVLATDPVEEGLGVGLAEAVGEDLAVEFLSDVKSLFGLFYPSSWDESIDGAPGDSYIRRLVPLFTIRRCARIASCTLKFLATISRPCSLVIGMPSRSRMT